MGGQNLTDLDYLAWVLFGMKYNPNFLTFNEMILKSKQSQPLSQPPPWWISRLFFWKDCITNKMPSVTKTPVIGAQLLLLASSESSQPPLLPCCKCHMSDVVGIKLQRFKWAQRGRLCVINHHNVKDYHHPRPTCFHSPFHTGCSCATKHGILTSLSLLI